MKKCILASSLMLMAFSVSAAGLSCEELKTRIEKKVQGKGVTGYTLIVTGKDTETKNRVVGTCEKGTMKIIYEKPKGKAAAEKTS